VTQFYKTVKALADLGAAYRYDEPHAGTSNFDHSTVVTVADDSATDTSRIEEKARQIESTEGYEI
jgi:hypothetical protein